MDMPFKEWERAAFAAFQEITKDIPRRPLDVDLKAAGGIILNGYTQGKTPEEVAQQFAKKAGIIWLPVQQELSLVQLVVD